MQPTIIWLDLPLQSLWKIQGAGRCAAASGVFLAETAAAAVAKLKRRGACEDFVVGSVDLVTLEMPR